MGKFVIEGGKRLCGKIKAERAKNSVLPIIAASLLTEEEVVIKDCPDIADVKNMLAIVGELGVNYRIEDDNLIMKNDGLKKSCVSRELSRKLRSSVLLAGALVAVSRRAEIAFPGGCRIGKRPVDMHLAALNVLGVKTEESETSVSFSCDRLCGGVIELSIPSVGATENALIAACAAEGETLIKNAAREPEIVDLANFLRAMGGKISGAGTEIIRVTGVKKFHGTEYRPVFDRIETGTYLVAAAITGGEIEISGVRAENISALIGKLCDNTCKMSVKNDIIYLRAGKRRSPVFVKTGYYPYFPTDMQAQTTALAAVSDGVSVIEESVFENRFSYTSELNKMGADISVNGRTAIVNGVKRLCGAEVCAEDLRGGAALVLAGLNAEGKTVVSGSEHIERGYAHIEKKLKELGADIVKAE